MKKWCHKININSIQLEPELNAFSEQGWEIYRVFRCLHDNYEIIAFNENGKNSTKKK